MLLGHSDCYKENKAEPSTPENLTKSSSPVSLCMCLNIILIFFAELLLFLIGVILGAIFSGFILSIIQILIAIIVVLAVLIISIFILKRCLCCPKTRRCGK